MADKKPDQWEGPLQISVFDHDSDVVLAFSKEITWIALDPDKARTLARAMLEKADKLSPERIN